MSATAWFAVAIVGFSLAGVALAAAAFMFIKMNIPAIIGDLSGKTVAREIRAMRDANASSGDKRFRSSRVNLERGTLTEKVLETPMSTDDLKKAHASKRLDKTGDTAGAMAANEDNTGALPTDILGDNATEVLSDNATEVLSDSADTEVLSADTEVLAGDGKAAPADGTTVLDSTEELSDKEETPVTFRMVDSQVLIHSDEVIE